MPVSSCFHGGEFLTKRSQFGSTMSMRLARWASAFGWKDYRIVVLCLLTVAFSEVKVILGDINECSLSVKELLMSFIYF